MSYLSGEDATRDQIPRHKSNYLAQLNYTC